MIKTGFFGGSFDPIHLGHLAMAHSLIAKGGLDEIWFSPAYMSPFKIDSTITPISHRLAMCRAAIEDEPRFALYRGEAEKSAPSYTVDTLQELIRIYAKKEIRRQFYLVLSDELLPSFPRWKEASTIVESVPLAVGSRSYCGIKPPVVEGFPKLNQAIERGWVPSTPLMISSSDIRERLREKLDCSDLLPRKVLDYILQNRLYL